VVAAFVLLLVIGRPQVWGQTPLLSEDEAALLVLINDYRSEHGLSTLKASPALSAAARWMSEDMAEHNRVSHTDSLGRSLSERMAAFGYTQASLWGEIIRAGTDTPEGIFEAWRNSPGHNAVMLTDGFVVAGVGKAYNPQSPYGWFWTVDFGDSLTASLMGAHTPMSTLTQTLSPTPAPGHMVGCPAADKWSLAVWTGGDDTPTGEALATCGAGTVDFTYYIDPDTQDWVRYFVGRTEISDLLALDNMQGFFAHGTVAAPPSTPTATPAAGDPYAEPMAEEWTVDFGDSLTASLMGAHTPMSTPAPGRMVGCPAAGKWSLAVWTGSDGTDTGQALAACQAGAVAAAYYMSPDTQLWSRWFPGRPEVSDLQALNDMQAVIALGAESGS